MSVINSEYDCSLAAKNQKCNACGEILSFPFVEWHGHVHVFFCAECCSKIKSGLYADLTQVGATYDIAKLNGFGDVLLSRTSRKQVREKDEKVKAEEDRLWPIRQLKD